MRFYLRRSGTSSASIPGFTVGFNGSNRPTSPNHQPPTSNQQPATTSTAGHPLGNWGSCAKFYAVLWLWQWPLPLLPLAASFAFKSNEHIHDSSHKMQWIQCRTFGHGTWNLKLGAGDGGQRARDRPQHLYKAAAAIGVCLSMSPVLSHSP